MAPLLPEHTGLCEIWALVRMHCISFPAADTHFPTPSLQGLIFVVDSNDRDRIGEARDELHRMLNEVQCAVPPCAATPPSRACKAEQKAQRARHMHAVSVMAVPSAGCHCPSLAVLGTSGFRFIITITDYVMASVCRMSCAKLCCWCSPTSRICRTP